MWGSVDNDITSLVQDFFKHKHSLWKINKTFLVYISKKKKKPQNLNEFRPISLYNVTYKIIAKVVANKLQRLLNKVIGPFLSAFMGGRAISDNYIVAHEIIHSF